MSSQERTFQGRFNSLRAYALVIGMALLAAGCGGGSDTSSGFPASPGPQPGPTPGPSPSPTPTTIQLTAITAGQCDVAAPGYTPTIAFVCSPRAYPKDSTGAIDPAEADAYVAYLDGRQSTPTDGTLTYQWTLLSTPTGSLLKQADIANANTALANFTPDMAGTYIAQLVVSEQGVSSQRTVETVTVYDDAIMAQNRHFHGGQPSACNNCHNGTSPTVLSRTSTHMATSNVCEACHATYTFAVTPVVDHVEVLGKCSSCHDGVTATGKGQYHIQTSQECSDCHHDTTTWFDVAFDHSNITHPCSYCHDGKTAIGTDSAPGGHIAIGVLECNSCHTTFAFKPANVNHNDPTVQAQACGSSNCHGVPNAVNAYGTKDDPNPPHPTTTGVDCGVCHTIAGFNMNRTFDHSVLGQPVFKNNPVACKECHDGISADGYIDPPAPSTFQHATVLAAGTDCLSCHNTVGFSPAFVDHTTIGTAVCTSCHGANDAQGNLIATGVPTDAIHSPGGTPIADVASGNCGACHTPGGSFRIANIDHMVEGYNTQTTDCSVCHDGVTATGKPNDSIHNALTGTQLTQCGQCHLTLPVTSDQFKSWAGAGFDHSTLSTSGSGAGMVATPSRCDSCHDGSQSSTVMSSTHVPVKDKTGNVVDCVACHGSDIITVPTTKFNLTTTAFDHAGIMNASGGGFAFDCNSCHNGKPHDGLVVITRPGGHIPSDPTDCSVCHNDTSYTVSGTNTKGQPIVSPQYGGFATAALFFSTDPTVKTVHYYYTSGCRTCHGGAYENAPYNAYAENHGLTTPLSTTHATANANNVDCSSCHSVSGNWADGQFDHTTLATTPQACIGCHADGNTTSSCSTAPDPSKCAVGRSSSHVNTNGDNNCQDCHSPGGSFNAGFDHSKLIVSPNGTPTVDGTNSGVTCINCHDGINAKGQDSANLPDPLGSATVHVTTSRNCFVCHTAYPPAATSFAGGTFDHTAPGSEALNTDCLVCHGDKVVPEILMAYQKKDYPKLSVTDKGGTHTPTNATCSACHQSFVDFSTATSYDHSKLTASSSCLDSGCHDANNSPGGKTINNMPGTLPHIPIVVSGSTLNCSVCHTSPGASFTYVTMDHTAVTSATSSNPAIACDSCHDGGHQGTGGTNVAVTNIVNDNSHFKYASTKNITISITSCGSGSGGCHNSTSSWSTTWSSPTAIPYSHGKNGYPGNHNTTSSTVAVTKCNQCHSDTPSNADISFFPDTANGYGTTCATCHAKDFKQNNHSGGVSSNKACGNCHSVKGTRFSG